MLKTRVMNLFRRLRGGPCPECSTPRPIEWYEVDADCEDEAAEDADRENADPGPPVCPRCGRPLAVSFIEVVRPK